MSSPPRPPNRYSDPSGTPAPGSRGDAAPVRKRRGLLIAGGAAGTLVVLGAIGSIGADNDEPSGSETTTATTVSTTTTATTTTTTTTTTVLSTEAPAPSDTVIGVPTVEDGATQHDVPPPVLVPTPDVSAPQTTHMLVPSAPAVAPFRSCAAARAAGAAPVYRGEPGYSSAIDRDGDGVACEGS